MKNKKLLSSLIGAILISSFLLGITSCKKKEPETIKIGAILPLTGYLAYLGEEERNCLELAVEETKNVKIIYQDSKGSASDGVTALQALLLQKPHGIICALTRVTEAIAPIIDNKEVPTFALSIHPTIASRSKFLFRAYVGEEDIAKKWLQYIKSKKAKKIGALYIRDSSIDEAISFLEKSLKEIGAELVVKETYEFTDKDLRPQLIKIKENKCDLIVTEDFGNLYPIILKEAENLGIRTKIIGGIGMLTIPQLDPKLVEGIVFAAPQFSIVQPPQYGKFIERYQDKFKRLPTFDGIYTYISFKILYEALSVNNGNKKKAIEWILEKRKFKIFDEEYQFEADGTGKCPVALGIFHEGKILPLELE
jgi:branched-chain amino acid transport system substrate-binding protein